VEIYYQYSSNGGASWTASDRLTNTTYSSLRPHVFMNGAGANLVWYEDIFGNTEIYYASGP